MKPFTLLTNFAVLTIGCVVLFGYNFISAQNWAPPGVFPPGQNVEAPLNSSASTQIKSGNLQLNTLAATGQVWSNKYCNADGSDCLDFFNLFQSLRVIQVVGFGIINNGQTVEADCAVVRPGTQLTGGGCEVTSPTMVEIGNNGNLLSFPKLNGEAWVCKSMKLATGTSVRATALCSEVISPYAPA